MTEISQEQLDQDDDDRRRASRLPLMLPASIDTKQRAERFGMTRNVSRCGLLLATPSRFAIGERAIIRLRTGSGDGEERAVKGLIVRLEMNRADEVGLWPYLMAVRLDEPLTAAEIGAQT